MNEKVNEEIFSNVDEAVAIVWWLVYLLGGKVTFPTTNEFWEESFPANTRLVLTKEDDQLVMRAETLGWQ